MSFQERIVNQFAEYLEENHPEISKIFESCEVIFESDEPEERS